MAKKTAKKGAIKLDFSDSTKAIKETAKTINTQAQEVATEVADDLKDNVAVLTKKAKTQAQKTYDQLSDKINWEYLDLAKATKSVNEFTLKTADDIVDGVAKNGAKWQGVAEKAIQGGLKLTAKQQDIMFDTLETFKGQINKGSKRLKQLLYN
ncbi:MAG: hypothetical protein AAF741_06900 [Bacteroidota bacterium]